MSLENEVKLLRNVSLLANVEPSKLKLLAFTSEWETYQGGDFLCRQGDVGDAAFIIIEGDADVIVDTPDGEAIIATRGANDVIGEIAILCDVPRTASVRAQNHLVTLKITKDVFLQLITGYPQTAVEILRILADRLHHTTTQLREAMTRAAAAGDH
jgi:CRP-like cAMP-binding protein